MKLKKLLGALTLMVASQFAKGGVICATEDLSSVTPRANIDFATSIQPIFDAHCSNCHGSINSGGMNLSSGVAYGNLVNVPSYITTAGIPRVMPFSLDNSFLFKKINCTDLGVEYGFRMPMAFEPGLPQPPPLSPADQAAIRDWIVQGALPAAQSIKLGGYLSGNWFIPSQGGGQGFQLEFTDAVNSASGKPIMLAIWFVYTPAGSTANDGSGQNWIYAQGDYDTTTSTVTLPAILLAGARFPPNYVAGDVHRVPNDASLWGNITFAFTDCNNGTVSWHSDLPGYNNANDTSVAIQRITKIAGTTCP